jgi:hypothetical protein
MRDRSEESHLFMHLGRHEKSWIFWLELERGWRKEIVARFWVWVPVQIPPAVCHFGYRRPHDAELLGNAGGVVWGL